MSSGTGTRDISGQQAAARQGMSLEQKLTEMAQQSRILEAYLNDTVTREITVTRLIEEARSASTTIQGVNPEADSETLMPIGIGVYVKTIVPAMKKLLVNMGAGVTIEKNREDALNYVESKIKEYEVALRQLGAQRQDIEMRMEQLQSQMNQMVQAAQGQVARQEEQSHSHPHPHSQDHQH